MTSSYRRIAACLVLLLSIGAGETSLSPGGPVYAGMAGAMVPSPSSTGTPRDGVDQSNLTKFYIVKDLGTGHREFLFDISARTLGTGKRYPEIFELNRGRVQPDGQRLSDPAVLQPGWVLQLPADASGPDVQTGVPPVSTAPDGGPAAASDGGGLARTVTLIVLVLMLTVALQLLRRGTRIRLPWRLKPAGAGAKSGSGRPTTDREDGAHSRVDPAGGLADGLEGFQEDFDDGSDLAADRTMVLAMRAVRSEAEPADLPAVPPRPRMRSGGTVSRPSPGWGRIRKNPKPTSPGEGDASAEKLEPPAQTSEPRPAVPPVGAAVDGVATILDATVTSDGDKMLVRFVGVRGPVGTPFAWYGREGFCQPAPAVVVRLGEGEGGILFVDLSLSPDVISVTGPAAGVRRRVRSIADQLESAGVATVVVGRVPGVRAGSRPSVAALGDVTGIPFGSAPRVVFMSPPERGDVAVAHRLVSQPQPRVVLIVAGDGPRARWSIEVCGTEISSDSGSSTSDEVDARPAYRKHIG